MPASSRPRIATDLLNRFLENDFGGGASQETILANVAAALREAGIERVRYYQLAKERVPQLVPTETFYLTWGDPELPSGLLGYSIPLNTASISASIAKGLRDPIQETGTTSIYPWIPILGLETRTWIDLVVSFQDRILGLLALDWTGDPIVLGTQEQTTLRLLGQLLGTLLAAAQPAFEHDMLLKMKELYEEDVDILHRSLTEFQRVVGISSLSLFRFDWPAQRLTRIRLFAPVGHDHDGTFAEERIRVGSYLTGHAWSDHNYRYVLDFSELQAKRPDLPSAASVRFHKEHFGAVNSVMYAVLGIREPRYLIRAINDSKAPKLPFIRKFALLKRFALALSPYVDAERSRHRAAAATTIQRLLGDDRPMAQVMESVSRKLWDVEGIRSPFLILGRARRGSTTPHYFFGVRDSERLDLRDALDAFPAWNTNTRDPVVLESNKTPFPGRLSQPTDPRMSYALFPVSSGLTSGILGFPVYTGAPAMQHPQLPTFLSDFVGQLGSLASAASEREFISMQSQGAMNALSLVGHEMAEPLASALQLGRRVIDASVQGLNSKSPVTQEQLKNWGARLDRQSLTLEAALQLGRIVGRLVDSRVSGVMRTIPLESVVGTAISRLYSEMKSGSLLVPKGGIRILSPAGQMAEMIACDIGLLEIAVLNLLRNAVKYSTPGIPPAQVSTTILVPDDDPTRLDLEVTNYGLAIDPLYHDAIFDAFTRFVEPQSSVARRGMGLGLYLVRQIALVHHGKATLRRQFRLGQDDDGAPRYETTFLLRVHRGLRSGQYARELGGQ